MMNKDVVIATTQESLLSTESENSIKALICMNKAATLASLYTILIVQDVQGQQNTIKVDRNILLILHKFYIKPGASCIQQTSLC